MHNFVITISNIASNNLATKQTKDPARNDGEMNGISLALSFLFLPFSFTKMASVCNPSVFLILYQEQSTKIDF